MMKLLYENGYISEAKKARFKPNVFLQILIFVGIFFITTFASSVPLIVYCVVKIINLQSGGVSDANIVNSLVYGDTYQLLSLICTVIVTVLVIIYCRFIERRSLTSMGFVKAKWWGHYLKGLLVGFVMFSVSVLICVISGSLRYQQFSLTGNIGMVLLFLLGFVIQGMEEEVLLRGYFMVSLSTRIPVIAAIWINAIFFACLHLLNPGIGVLPIINLILFGVFASVYVIKTNNIWGVCAIHSMWNFAQGNIYGILVSGMDMGASVFKFKANEAGTIFNGGSFGLEGGIAVTAVLIVSTILTLLYKNKDLEHQSE